MITVLVCAAALLPAFVASTMMLGRLLRRSSEGDLLSPVARQHFELMQGAHLNEADVAAAKRRFNQLLARGEIDRVESSLRPGTQFAIKVRALAEIGTDEAGEILEKQLRRQIARDPLEQSWYWIDLANSLRMLNREESLGALLECAAAAPDRPLMHFFAAETVCFPNFAAHLDDCTSPRGQAALRLLHKLFEGLRSGVPLQVVVEARLGEMIERLWDRRPDRADPLFVRLFVEVMRHIRRGEALALQFSEEPFEKEAFHLQHSRLIALEGAIEEWLQEAGLRLIRQLRLTRTPAIAEVLAALDDLRLDAGAAILELLKDPDFPCAEQAVPCLRWSRDPESAAFRRNWAVTVVEPHLRSQRPLRAWSPRRSSVPESFPYQAVLETLRFFPSATTEQFLLTASRDWDPACRRAAISSLCWWEPLSRVEVLLQLQSARFDSSGEVRHAARAALARLGERQALQWFRQALLSDNRACVLEAVHTVAQEGLTLLWPELDGLVDADEPDVAFFARECLEQMHEDLAYRQRQPRRSS
mgnify:CR=1 FL=1